MNGYVACNDRDLIGLCITFATSDQFHELFADAAEHIYLHMLHKYYNYGD